MSITDRLNQVLDIAPVPVTQENQLPATAEDLKEARISAHKQDDLQLARNTIVNLIQKSTDLLDDVINLAKESESPRAIEVTSNLIKTTADLSKDLIDIHSKDTQKKTSKDDSPGEQNNTQNNYYVGTTADLQKLIKEQTGGGS